MSGGLVATRSSSRRRPPFVLRTFPLQGELHSAALTTHCVVIHYRLDHRPLHGYRSNLSGGCRGGVRVSGGHLCEAEAPTEATAETYVPPATE